MKKYIFLFAVLLFSCSKQSPTDVTKKLWVRGNCEMCQERIQTSLDQIKGVKKTVWNVSTKELTVTYDSLQTNLKVIEQTCANVGHAPKTMESPQNVINKLPECCKPN